MLSTQNNVNKRMVYSTDILPHGFALQVADSVEDPVQLFPPLEGGGFVQVRCLVLLPPPHMALHFP